MKRAYQVLGSLMILFCLGCVNDDGGGDGCELARINLAEPLNGQPCTTGEQFGEQFRASFFWDNQSDNFSNLELELIDLSTGSRIPSTFLSETEATALVDYDKNYSWQIRAISCEKQTVSELWTFTTSGTPRTDNAPLAASIQIEEAFNSSARIRWTGFDEEGGVLNYTLFVDQNEDPQNVVESRSAESGEEQTLVIRSSIIQNPGEVYYVKVITTDGRGNRSIAVTSFLAN